MMNLARDRLFNVLEDAYVDFLKVFAVDTPEYTIAVHIITELRNAIYETTWDLMYIFVHRYPADQWGDLLYEFFHSKGTHRPKLDDLLATYWEYIDEPTEVQEVQEQIAVG
jgi:hypothetical protein